MELICWRTTIKTKEVMLKSFKALEKNSLQLYGVYNSRTNRNESNNHTKSISGLRIGKMAKRLEELG